jgi:hypothetical protein
VHLFTDMEIDGSICRMINIRAKSTRKNKNKNKKSPEFLLSFLLVCLYTYQVDLLGGPIFIYFNVFLLNKPLESWFLPVEARRILQKCLATHNNPVESQHPPDGGDDRIY